MLISVRRQLAFLAMPKTGTTAVEQSLAPLCEIVFGGRPDVKHMNLRGFQRFMLPYLETVGAGDVETVCVVREPVDWLSSWFRYRSRPALDGTPKSTKGMDFARFIEGYLERPQPAFARTESMSHFVSDRKERPAVTHLFRYDRMDGLVAFLSARFRKEISLATVNVSPRVEASLPKALRARLEVERADDFAIYQDRAR